MTSLAILRPLTTAMNAGFFSQLTSIPDEEASMRLRSFLPPRSQALEFILSHACTEPCNEASDYVTCTAGTRTTHAWLNARMHVGNTNPAPSSSATPRLPRLWASRPVCPLDMPHPPPAPSPSSDLSPPPSFTHFFPPFSASASSYYYSSCSCSSSSSSSSRLSYPIHRSWVPLSMSASDLASSSSSFLPIFLAGEKDGFSGDRRIEGWMSKQ